MNTLPEYEYYNVTLDTVGQDSANTFTCFLNQAIRNVVQAKLTAAHIKTTSATEHCYISITELDSSFSEHTSNVYEGQSDMSIIRNSFASLVTNTTSLNPTGNDSVLIFKDEYDVETNYAYPIRRIDRFRVTILDQLGRPIVPPTISGNNFIVLRLKCLSANV